MGVFLALQFPSSSCGMKRERWRRRGGKSYEVKGSRGTLLLPLVWLEMFWSGGAQTLKFPKLGESLTLPLRIDL